MKKFWLLAALLAVLCVSGCRRAEEPSQEETPSPPQPPVEEVEPPAQSRELRVELSRGDLSTSELAAAVKVLPGLLETYLGEDTGLHLSGVSVTVGASRAATAQTLAAKNIDLAFLPAEEFLLYGGDARALYADADLYAEPIKPGTRSLLCAAPTEYGAQLTQRAGSGKPLSWREVMKARWGVLEEDISYRGFDLWLADNYEGSRVEDLPYVTAYDSEEELFRAAAAGEIDAFPVRDDARAEVADVWTLAAEETDAAGRNGFGRTERIWDELAVLDVTERLCRVVAAAAPDEALADKQFVSALQAALDRLAQEHPELMPALGAQGFAPVEDVQLDPIRRLVAMDE